MADINEAFKLQETENIDNPYVLIDNSKYSDFDDKSYSLNVVDDLRHNNMQPSFRKKNYGTDYKQTTNVFQTKMDLFSGSKNQIDWRPKKEVESLFKPAENGGYVYGKPVQTELFKSRFIPSMQRNGEKPFQEIRVQPGLNLGANEESNVGFHDPYRAMPRNVDELRTKNNPKLSYKQPVIPGLKSSFGPKEIDIVNKKKPERFKALGTYQLNPTGASFSMPSVFGRVNPLNLSKTDNRGKFKNDGIVSGAYLPSQQQIIDGEHSQPIKQNFLKDTPTNIRGYKTNQIYNSKELDSTNRSLFNYDDFTNVGKTNNLNYIYNNEGYIPNYTLRDIIKVKDINRIINSNKQNTKSYIYNLNGLIPNETLRNIFYYENFGNIGSNNISYVYDKSGTILVNTLRNIQKIEDNNGNIKNFSLSYIYNKQGTIPVITKRDLYKYKDLSNVKINKKDSYIFNTNGTVPDITNRNLYNYNDLTNTTSKIDKSYIYNTNGTTPDPTNRNLYNYDDISNTAGNTDKSYIYNLDGTVPDITKRDLYKYKDISNLTSKKSYVYDKKGTTPTNTNRNMFKNNDIYRSANASSFYKPATREDINNMTIRETKEKLNLTYRKPETNKKTISQIIPKQHLKDGEKDNNHFNPANMTYSIID